MCLTWWELRTFVVGGFQAWDVRAVSRWSRPSVSQRVKEVKGWNSHETLAQDTLMPTTSPSWSGERGGGTREICKHPIWIQASQRTGKRAGGQQAGRQTTKGARRGGSGGARLVPWVQRRRWCGVGERPLSGRKVLGQWAGPDRCRVGYPDRGQLGSSQSRGAGTRSGSRGSRGRGDGRGRELGEVVRRWARWGETCRSGATTAEEKPKGNERNAGRSSQQLGECWM